MSSIRLPLEIDLVDVSHRSLTQGKKRAPWRNESGEIIWLLNYSTKNNAVQQPKYVFKKERGGAESYFCFWRVFTKRTGLINAWVRRLISQSTDGTGRCLSFCGWHKWKSKMCKWDKKRTVQVGISHLVDRLLDVGVPLKTERNIFRFWDRQSWPCRKRRKGSDLLWPRSRRGLWLDKEVVDPGVWVTSYQTHEKLVVFFCILFKSFKK